MHVANSGSPTQTFALPSSGEEWLAAPMAPRQRLAALADRKWRSSNAVETRISSCNSDIGCCGDGHKRARSSCRYSRSSNDEGRCNATAVHSADRYGLQPRRHIERLDASLAHEWRLERVPPGCGACRS